ncbi:hypothetical protein HN011_008490, partial [Eciton burchellii]
QRIIVNSHPRRANGYRTQHEIPLVHLRPALDSDGGFRIPSTGPAPAFRRETIPNFPWSGDF